MTKTIITTFIALVWLINGLVCKVLNVVPRHTEIVATILGEQYARPLTILIGLAEVVMAIWIWSRYRSKLSATLQIVIVLLMNILEIILAPDLLLWGKWNLLFAILFVILVYWNEFGSPLTTRYA